MQWQEQGLSHVAENFMPNSTFMSCPKISGVFAPGTLNEQHCTTQCLQCSEQIHMGTSVLPESLQEACNPLHS